MPWDRSLVLTELRVVLPEALQLRVEVRRRPEQAAVVALKAVLAPVAHRLDLRKQRLEQVSVKPEQPENSEMH